MPPTPSNVASPSPVGVIGSGMAGAALSRAAVPAQPMSYSSVVRGNPAALPSAPEVVGHVSDAPSTPITASVSEAIHEEQGRPLGHRRARDATPPNLDPHQQLAQREQLFRSHRNVSQQLQRVVTRLRQFPEGPSGLHEHEAALRARQMQLEQQIRDDRRQQPRDGPTRVEQTLHRLHQTRHQEFEEAQQEAELRRQAQVQGHRMAHGAHTQHNHHFHAMRMQQQQLARMHQGHPFSPHGPHGMTGSDDDSDRAFAMHRHYLRHQGHPFGMHHHHGMSDSDVGSPRREAPTGYPEDWVEEENRTQVTHEMSCVICADIMRNPTTTPCGHTFCRDCICHVPRAYSHMGLGPRPCPLCRDPVSRRQLRPATALAGAIDALVGKCPKCSFRGPLSDVRTHELECDTQRALAWLRNVLPAGSAAVTVTDEMRADAVRALSSNKLIDLFAGLLGRIDSPPATAE